MDTTAAIACLTALAQPTRMSVFRRLLAAYPEGLAAGDIARLCGVPHNTMSTHLAVLARAGLVAVERRGRTVACRADLDRFRFVIRFLTRDCCGGRPELCGPLAAEFADPACASVPEAEHA